MWQALERALLAEFKERYGALPYYNSKGSRYSVEDTEYFRRSRLASVLTQLA